MVKLRRLDNGKFDWIKVVRRYIYIHRSTRFALYPCGDVYVHGEITTLYNTKCYAREITVCDQLP